MKIAAPLLAPGLVAALCLTVASPIGARAQAAAAPAVSSWRTVAPENLLIIETSKGRVLVELEPRVAPNHVERVRTLANQGFYDGLTFHRVIADFMAQTGDPLGTGQGGSDLPDIAAELSFRRGRDAGFAPVQVGQPGSYGVFGSLPVITQPDAQMFVTADMKVDAGPLFCPGVVGMARSASLDSANSQFFLMSGANANLNGAYTAFGRVLAGNDVVRSLKVGANPADGRVTDNPDTMIRVRTASEIPAAQRPSARVANASDPAFTALVEQTRRTRGAAFTICDVQPPVDITGG